MAIRPYRRNGNLEVVGVRIASLSQRWLKTRAVTQVQRRDENQSMLRFFQSVCYCS